MRRAKGSLKSEVRAALWTADRPLTAGEVADALGGELAYTTVQTILVRPHGKGAVHRKLTGRAHSYTPVLDDAGLAADQMRAMLDKGADHAAVLSCFLRVLSPEDEAILTRLLRQERPGLARQLPPPVATPPPITVAEAMHDTERLFELAQSAYRPSNQ